MHVLHVITSLYAGGAQSALFRLCISDKKNKHTVVTMIGGGELEAKLEAKGISVQSMGLSRKGGFFKGANTLWKLLKKNQPDLVQTWMYHPDLIGGLCARLAGIRHVCWGIRHTELEAGKSSRSSILAARLCASLSGIVPGRIICCAEEAARVHHALGYRFDKMTVIPNGYDLADFYPRETIADGPPNAFLSDTEQHLPLLGMVGRFNPQKDHRNLLQALSELSVRGFEFRCLLVGANLDCDNSPLCNWLKELGLENKVKLLGLRSDIADIMNSLDLHILSSSFGEAFPNVIAEAMACGTPCVGTDVGDTAAIIGECGWVVPPNDSRKLADAIQAALVERDSAPARWAERCRSSAERIQANYSIDRMVAAFDSVWTQCMEAKH